jgi:myo-inositol-1(or 4)-monophosphatase
VQLTRYELAVSLACKAGKLLLEFNRENLSISTKSTDFDLVTKADFASQKLIVDNILNHFPNDGIIAEESCMIEGISGFSWVIDPLDGTVNFAHGFPTYCVSIGIRDGEIIQSGIVFDPNRDEMFVAQKGKGAFLNNRQIFATPNPDLCKAMLATGFPYDRSGDSKRNNIEYFAKFCLQSRAIRRLGSAALDLCYVACGRLDGFWELKLRPWDVCAGVLIVTEAGGKVTDFYGFEYNIFNPYIIASNGKFHQDMVYTLEV